MQQEENTFKDLAFKYFEGRIPRAGETALYDFMKDEANREKFRRWEVEWTETSAASGKTQGQWERLRMRIMFRESAKDKVRRRRNYLRALCPAVAAAAVILLVVSVFPVQAPRPFTMEAPFGAKSCMYLPDSSMVWLNSGSSVRFSDSFGKKDRELFLTGEGYFEVAKDKSLPFVVRTDICDVTVCGTKFNVAAYPTDGFVRTSVLEGLVQVSHDGSVVSVSAGQSVLFDREKEVFIKSSVAPESVASWRENRLEYPDITLRDLSDILHRNYDCAIIFLSGQYADEHLSISFRNNETIDDVLEAIRRILPVKMTREGNTVYIE